MRAHVANFRPGDRERFNVDNADDAHGYHSDGSNRSDRSELGSKRRKRNDSVHQQPAPPPPPPKKGAHKGDTSGEGSGNASGKGVVGQVSTDVVPVGSSSRDSPRTVPISVYRKVCQQRDLVDQERDTARVAARAVPGVEQELATARG